MGKSDHIVWHSHNVTKSDRRKLNGHKSCVLWLTGLSGSGKSTLANALEMELFNQGIRSYVLDGDNIRFGLNKNLGFSPEDRRENIRRIGEVAKLFVDAGVFVITAFISPYQADRDMVREMFEEGEFIELYVECPLQECEQRDPKGLYKKARTGEVKEFTGISAPYEVPENPQIVIRSHMLTVEESVQQVMDYLREEHLLS